MQTLKYLFIAFIGLIVFCSAITMSRNYIFFLSVSPRDRGISDCCKWQGTTINGIKISLKQYGRYAAIIYALRFFSRGKEYLLYQNAKPLLQNDNTPKSLIMFCVQSEIFQCKSGDFI